MELGRLRELLTLNKSCPKCRQVRQEGGDKIVDIICTGPSRGSVHKTSGYLSPGYINILIGVEKRLITIYLHLILSFFYVRLFSFTLDVHPSVFCTVSSFFEHLQGPFDVSYVSLMCCG